MNKILKAALFLLCTTCFLCSCGSSLNVTASIEIKSSKSGKLINPKDVIITETYTSFESKNFFNYQVLPSIGDVNLLVIPILLPGYEVIDFNDDGISDNETVRNNIETAFFGEDDKNLSYESVSSYFKKSSFNQLNLSGEVTPWFNLSNTDLNFSSAAEIDVLETYDVVEEAVNWARNTLGINMQKYDSDSDGYIDGVWCIYSAPNYTNGGPHTDSQNFWAYTSYGNVDRDLYTPSIDEPIYNLFGWASYDFMYDGIVNKVDAHTYIHETGHFLGLKDLYSDYAPYNPVGKVDMMDANIIDLNSYAKMLLGWSKPYIVTGTCKINLLSMQNKNSFIVIPDDNYEINNNEFDPFSEYILIDLYTPYGLNELDSKIKHSYSPLAPNNNGVRIYHIDNRKFVVDMISSYQVNTSLYDGHPLKNTESLILPISNNRNIDAYNYAFGVDKEFNLYDEIRLIEKENVDTFTFGGRLKDSSLFVKGDIFNLETYGNNFFVNKDKFNNGNPFTYEINIKEIR